MSERPTLTLIDGSAYIYRAYHALPSLSTAKGQPTNAVLGFTNMVLKALREGDPTHVAMVFDARGGTFRDTLYPDYKANRRPPPDDLVSQFPLVRQVTHALNLAVFEVPGVEADDVIATLAERAVATGFRVRIITGDKDFMQLVTPEVELLDTMRDHRTGVAEVQAKLGIRPDQVVDYLSLIGDDVDNVPGLDGVGPKTASKLLQDNGTLAELIAHPDRVTKPKQREQLEKNGDRLRLNQELIRLKRDVKLDLEPAQLARRPIDQEACRKLFAELEFTRLVRDLPAPPPETVEASTTQTRVVRTTADLQDLLKALESTPRAAVRTLGEHAQRPVGIAFAITGQGAWYVPLGHRLLLDSGTLPEVQSLDALKPYLEGARPKAGHRIKDDRAALRRSGIQLNTMTSDSELASFLLNSARREHALPDLSRERLRRDLPAEVIETGKKARPLAELEIEKAATFAGAGAEAALALCEILEKDLHEKGLWDLYAVMEIPLVPVLAQMEEAGIQIDRDRLVQMDAQLDASLRSLLQRIYQHAGHEFAVGSNQQLGKILFEELKLPVQRKTKTGPSVDVETLEKLAEMHPLPSVLLEHRSLAKLKSTYLDTLPGLADEQGRVHTTYVQTGAATGRLSSIDPNLQNIPVRTDVGRQIREAFIAPPGFKLVSADYSQIELRVLAHLSSDPALLESFAGDEDVHTRTAAEIHGIPTAQVTPELRRQAKAVNFGIAYGQTSYGLSQRLGIEPKAAQEIIDRYFVRYAGVRTWLDQTIMQARRDLEVSTIFGRRRAVADLISSNMALRQGAERIAVNTPIQGTAADIMKRAMLRVDEQLRAQKLKARMLLQVHDELVFEVPEAEVERLSALAVAGMEGAAQLKVRLKVDVGHSQTWGGAH